MVMILPATVVNQNFRYKNIGKIEHVTMETEYV